jgi:hypothetical protein
MKAINFTIEVLMLVPDETKATDACFKDFVSFKDVPMEDGARVLECSTIKVEAFIHEH